MTEYSFETLSPHDFELLVKDLLHKEYGWRLESFRRGPDGGVDLRATSSEGRTVVVQCKHYARSTISDLKRSVKLELPKIKIERPDRYIFATSMELSRSSKDHLIELLHPWISSPNDVLCGPEINAMLRNYPEVERSHFKLWLASAEILDQIVHSGSWQRTRSLMTRVKNRVRYYVRTQAFAQASELLAKKGVVVITGQPGVGKTMLAEMLCLSHWDAGWQVVDVPSHKVDEAWELMREGKNQVFLFDDVFGQTDLSERLGRGVGATVNGLVEHVAFDPSKRLIITTRLQVLRVAEQRDERVTQARLSPKQCVLEVRDFGKMHRARVVYNHLYFSTLSRTVLSEFVEAGGPWQVISHNNFTPRIIEQIILKQDHRSGNELMDRLLETLDKPALLWGPSFREFLSALGRRVLLQLSAFPVRGTEPSELRERVIDDSEPFRYTEELQSLEGTWLQIERDRPYDPVRVAFQDPSCRDFIVNFLNEETAHLRSVLNRTSTLSEATSLLGYCLSRTLQTDVPKFAGYNEWASRNADLVRSAILRGWEHGLEIGDDVVSRLGTVLELNHAYDLQLSDWLVDAVYSVMDRVEEQGRIVDSTSAELLLRHILRVGRVPQSEDEEEAFVGLFAEWCRDLTHEDEWTVACDFVADVDGLGLDELVQRLNIAFEEGFLNWLDNELSELSTHTTSYDEADRVLDHLRNFANGFLSSRSVEDKIEVERNNQQEKYYLYEPSPDELDEVAATRKNAEIPHWLQEEIPWTDDAKKTPSENDQIADMFRQLGS